MSQQAAYF